ncbi:MAG TPA: FAD-binding protein [Deltaproteobacteria bacterium]|nr:FAD-binding protein [Deltaproteobacteria bacterium]HEC32072.1 FAD-binding protein [Deltaproteobacteria bacterium]
MPEVIRRSERKMTAGLKEQDIYDLIIIGAGPAGMSAGIYAARKLLKTLLISKNVGGQVTDAWEIDNYLGFSQVDPAGLIKKFNEHVEKFSIEKIIARHVASLQINDDIKSVTTDDGKTYYAKTLIIATGKRPRKLGLPEEEKLGGKGVAYCATCDAPLFAGADVAVAGGGNSALEAAMDLIKIANSVHIVSITPLTGDPIYQDKLRSSDKVTIYTEHEIVKLVGDTVLEGLEIRSLKTGETKRLDVEGLFVEIGLLPNSDIVKGMLNLNQYGEIVVDYKCHTGFPGVFACGDVTNVPFKQVIVAAGEGAKAALAAYEYLISGN